MSQRPAFRAATDRLKKEGGLPLNRVAKLFGVTPGTITRWRSLSPKERLTPPATWRASLAVLARREWWSMTDRRENLEALAMELEAPEPTEQRMTFREATALLINRDVPTRAIAHALGLKPQTVRAMRSGARNPPDAEAWVPALVSVAERFRFADLTKQFQEHTP